MPSIKTGVHGNAVVAQSQGGFTYRPIINSETGHILGTVSEYSPPITGVPLGWGKEFRCAGGVWFHLPIPTISMLDGSQLYLDQFHVFFGGETRGGHGLAGIKDIHMWDGSASPWSSGVLSRKMTGDWSYPRSFEGNSNTWFPRHPETGHRFHISTGLSISLLAEFSETSKLVFYSAGASWVDSRTDR